MPADWPGGVRHGGDASPVCGFCMEREKAGSDTARSGLRAGEREKPERCMGVSTVAGSAGGPARSSGEAPVMGVERRGRVICGCVRSINRNPLGFGRSRVNELKSPDKPFEISKWAVKEAWEKVKANKGAPGWTGCRSRSSRPICRTTCTRSGIGCPRALTFRLRCARWRYPKPHGGGTRMLGRAHRR